MKSVNFEIPEYHKDGSFKSARYKYEGSSEKGWEVYRNEEPHLSLGPGFILLKGESCGICSTDLHRMYLPYPLPQIIGHEFVGSRDDKLYTSDINASHQARGLKEDNCPWCSSGMHTHCPGRITLGINQLPGGFSPWVLVPEKGIYSLPLPLDAQTGTLIEPFSAALNGVVRSVDRKTRSVAVVGPRKLGLLTIAALQCYRKEHRCQFEITAVGRNTRHQDLAHALGANHFLLLDEDPDQIPDNRFEVVFDTTGSPKGLETCTSLADKVLHIKSTHGQSVLGYEGFTEFVVNEMSLLPFKVKSLAEDSWKGDKGETDHCLVSTRIEQNVLDQAKRWNPTCHFHQLSFTEAENFLRDGNNFPEGAIPRFNKAMISSLNEVESLLHRDNPQLPSLLIERGSIVLTNTGSLVSQDVLSRAVREKGLEVHSSRCGSFKYGIETLCRNPEIIEILKNEFISTRMSLDKLKVAMSLAEDPSQSLKVIVDTGM